jgi:sugar/nucleoside kinase (ribokinase family)
MKTNARYDVVGIGNAIVDVIAQAEDDLLMRLGLHKGGMTLIDESKSAQIYDQMGPATISSGGSAANTMVGMASLGGKAAFVGKVRDDESGHSFKHDIEKAGVSFSTGPNAGQAPTAHCLVLVTPDGERTMSTFLGACVELGPEDIDEKIIADSRIVYFEGYLWDPPRAKDAFRKAVRIAHDSEVRVALTLSDAFCVDRYRDEFIELIRTGAIDILFANESELHALYQTADFDTAVGELKKERLLGFVTRSEKGCVIVDHGKVESAPAASIERLVDTTGAGDLFAAGVLFGLAQDLPNVRCAAFGALAAAEVIQHIGARPQVKLSDLVAQAGV